MPNREMFNSIKVGTIRAPILVNSSTHGLPFDTRGCDAVTILALVGASTGTPSTANRLAITLQESDSTATATFTNVSAADLVGEVSGTTNGTFAVLDGSSDLSQTYKVGYIGSKRYVRVRYVETGTFPGAPIGIAAVGSDLNYAPQ